MTYPGELQDAKNDLRSYKSDRNEVAVGAAGALVLAALFIATSLSDPLPEVVQDQVKKELASRVKDDLARQTELIEKDIIRAYERGETTVTFNLAQNSIDLSRFQTQMKQEATKNLKYNRYYMGIAGGALVLLASAFCYDAFRTHSKKVVPAEKRLAEIKARTPDPT